MVPVLLGENEHLTAKFFELRRKCEHLEEDKNTARSIAHRHERRIAELKDESDRHLDEVQRLGEVNRKLEEKLTIIKEEKEFEEINSTILEKTKIRLEGEVQQSEVRAAAAQGQIANLNQEVAGLTQQVAVLQQNNVCVLFLLLNQHWGGGVPPPEKT